MDPVKTILLEKADIDTIKRKEVVDKTMKILADDFSYKPKVSLNKKI